MSRNPIEIKKAMALPKRYGETSKSISGIFFEQLNFENVFHLSSKYDNLQDSYVFNAEPRATKSV